MMGVITGGVGFPCGLIEMVKGVGGYVEVLCSSLEYVNGVYQFLLAYWWRGLENCSFFYFFPPFVWKLL